MGAPAIVTDSNASLPPDLVRDLPLSVVPMEVHHDGLVYADGIDLSPYEFYRLLETTPILATTSAPQPGAFLRAFRDASATTNEVVCLTLSAELSATYAAALRAREDARKELPDVRVTVVDTRTAGTAQGLVALAAARHAAAGGSTDDVLRTVGRRIGDVCLYGYLESLRYLWRGGRVPRVLMWMGELLDVKPVLQLVDGKIGMVERPRTSRRAMDRLVALAAARLAGQPGRVAVMHAGAPDRAHELAERLQAALRPVELFVTELTPVIGAHTGPGLVGCALHPADER